ncbi:MAG: S9 family peptidase [Candidatus Aminicenantes bacterium]|nr:S9 family peptidase [Candidatus Aminicenantes bacterium]
MRVSRKRFSTVLVAVLFLASAAAGQTALKPLTLDDYDKWSRVASTAISPDGNWVAYANTSNKGTVRFFVTHLADGKTVEVAGGGRPEFSDDSKWIGYLITPSEEEREKLLKANQPAVVKAELRNLASGQTAVYENVQSIAFSPGGKFFLVKKTKTSKDAKHGGTDLIIRNLETGLDENIGNVGLFTVDKTGARLAVTFDAADQTGNGLVLIDLKTGVRAVLDSGQADYAQLSWDEKGTALAVLKGTKKKESVQKDNVLIVVRGLDTAAPQTAVYDPAKDAAFPKDMVASEFAPLHWTKDLSRIYFGIKEQEKEVEKPKGPVADVDVWHYKDEQIQSVQMVRASRDRNRTWQAALILDGMKVVRLADDSMRSFQIADEGRFGLGSDPKPYIYELNWGGAPADYYRVDTETGERSLIEKKIARPMGLSPDGRWFLYLKNGQVFGVEMETGKKTSLTAQSPVSFVNVDDDHPYEKPAWGVAGWLKGGSAVILNHRFDLWSIPLDGGRPVNLTSGLGDKEQVVFRYMRLDPEEKFIDPSKPLLLSAFGEWTKKSGFYSLRIGSAPAKIVFEDLQFGRLTKAKSADRYLYTKGTFVDFPDYYVSDGTFASPKRITKANPQQAEYAWGRRVLVDFKNRFGKRLQATLTLPAGYEKGKRYPMIVYFYEKVSNGHHQYSMPTYDDRPHMSLYASNGYLVLQPDIVYEIGKPGTSALDCVTGAAKKVIELGYADPKRIGIQGHSWGGYQTSYIATQTDMFACVVTGAPPTNLVSFYDELYKSTGTSQNAITEKGQVRMGVSPWANMKLYEDQSAIFNAAKIKTPILILHGTNDGAVDWRQGLEYYNAGRRLGKQIILLSYPGEDHHLRRKENQVDFLHRMKEYFDHYLKGEKAPDWLENGIPFLKKKTADTGRTEGGRGR